jgi:hypothetical protein
MPDSLARQRAVSRPATGAVTAADAAALLRAIERAAADPNVGPDRLDHLAALYERTLAREAEATFNAALAKLQPKLPVLEERGEIADPDGAVKATYATWDDTVEAIRPLLARHGFSLSFKAGRSAAAGFLSVIGVLRHAAGHKEDAELQLPADPTGDKNAVQAIGSTVTYGQRYVAKMLLNLVSRGTDDDGAAAGKTGAELAAIAEINALADRPAFLAWKRANRTMLGELSNPAFQRVIGHYGVRLRRLEDAAREAA